MKLKNKKIIQIGIACCAGAAAFGLGLQVVRLLSYLNENDIAVLKGGALGILLPLGVYSGFSACYEPIKPSANQGTEPKLNTLAANRPLPRLEHNKPLLLSAAPKKHPAPSSSKDKPHRKFKR